MYYLYKHKCTYVLHRGERKDRQFTEADTGVEYADRGVNTTAVR